MTTTDDVGLEQSDLRSELRSLQSATEGELVEGVVTSQPAEGHAGEFVELEVETPISEFRERYEKPKPPLEDYEFTRVAEKYGTGLADITDLEGATVLCRYCADDESWTVVTPEPDRSLHERLAANVTFPPELRQTKESFLTMLAFAWLLYPVMMIVVPFEPESNREEDIIASVLWTLVIYALIIAGIGIAIVGVA